MLLVCNVKKNPPVLKKKAWKCSTSAHTCTEHICPAYALAAQHAVLKFNWNCLDWIFLYRTHSEVTRLTD